MQIYVTRSKVFMSTELVDVTDPATGDKMKAERELRFFAQRQAEPTVIVAPDWIKSTLTYKVGIRDGSIKDMTPPEPSPLEAAIAVLEEKKDAAADEKKDEGKKADKGKSADDKAQAAGLQK